MKKVLYVMVVIASVITACYKPVTIVRQGVGFNSTNSTDSSYIAAIGKYVQLHPAMGAMNTIDFDGYRISKMRRCFYVRLPFKNKPMRSDFILLQTDSFGAVKAGRIIHLEEIISISNPQERLFNGHIVIRTLEQQIIENSSIIGGFIKDFHPDLFTAGTDSSAQIQFRSKAQLSQKVESFPVPKVDELPEVVVVAYLPSVGSSAGISVGDYMMLQSMFGGGGGGGSTGDGSGNGGSYGGGGNGYSNEDLGFGVYSLVYDNAHGGGATSSSATPHQDPNINLSYDESYFRPAIDLNAWMKCFTDIPDAGASCSVALLGDLPVNTNPSIGMNIWSGNTGHCFLQLKKTNGNQSVTQIIGFTAQSPFKAIVNTEAFVPSKIVDNAGHKYNCSITMPLTAAGLTQVINTIISQADMPYSVVNYDCLDFGLDVINSVRGNDRLKVDKTLVLDDPFSNVANGPKLYQLLSDMVARQSPESSNIWLSGPMYAGVSHGPCN